MTEKMKTVCVGRYLVDVPSQAVVSTSHERLDGFAIVTIEETEAAFQLRVSAREAEIGNQGADTRSRELGGMVEAHDLRIPGVIGRTFVYGRTRSHGFQKGRRVDVEWVSVESHAHIGGLSFSLSATYVEEADAKAADALLAQLRLRAEDEIPAMPGFCIRRAIFIEPLPAHTTEHIAMHLALPGHPDLALTLASMPGGGEEPNLIARTANTDASMGPDALLRMSKLREGKRTINGLEGEEVLMRAREFNFTTTYGFDWETPGVDDDPHQPYLSLELQTGISERAGGKPVDSSLHEDALLALWEGISSSIRLRKSNPPPSAPPPEPPGPKLGTVAYAGTLCPQSGWWRCDAGEPGLDVHGGQVQFLRKGEQMPQALLLPRQSLWQKVKRIQPSVESGQSTAWTLVDKRQRPRIASAVALAAPGVALGVMGSTGERDRIAALGTYVRTGEPCPASGWWRCEELQALDGARWFAYGSLLPTATFQVPTGVFARPGGPAFIQRRSGWQLVRYAAIPTVVHPTQLCDDGFELDDPPASV